jgi:predicted AAA+ superfamily ATPase
MKDAFSESLAGRKMIFEIWPLGFDEFLRFKNEKTPEYFGDFSPVPQFYINKYQPYYEEYLDFGGFPEIALLDNPEEKKAMLNDIFESFLQFDIKFLADFTKTDEVYKIINLLSARTGSKIDYTKLSGMSGINRHKVKDYLIFLEKAYFIRIITPFVVNKDREIALQPKIYFTDNGILNLMGRISSGALFENSVANQLSKKGKLNYYARRSGQEIDFILNGDTAIEVKETPSMADYRTLSRRAKAIGIDKYFLAGRYSPAGDFTNFVYGGSF